MGIAYNTSVVRDGLVLHLDAANVKSYPGSGTNWADLSGNGNNGTLVNDVGYSGVSKGILTFDGINDFVSLSPLNLSGTQLSICCFIRPMNLGVSTDVNVILRKGENNPNVYQFALGDSRICFILNNNDAAGRIGNTILTVGNWYHVAISYNAGAATAYLNGQVDGTATIPASIGNDTRATYIGSRNGGDYKQNHISNISVYNRALTQQEIRQNFEALRGRYGI